jgi:predicted regulator of Ras-like GTPase activity (Roadblock/LC7/MglB family)
VAVMLLPFINALLAKFGLSVSEAQLIAAMSAGGLYIAQSVTNAIHARSVAAAQANAPTPAAAVLDLNKGV